MNELARQLPLDTTDQLLHYAQAANIAADVSRLLRPADRISVSQSAARYYRIKNPGGYQGAYRPDFTPYTVEPMDELASRLRQAVVFCGPAQSGKTEIGLGWTAHTIKSDPSDMMLVDRSQGEAHDFSQRRLDRMLSASPALRAELAPGSRADNVFGKTMRSGIMIALGWPSKNKLAGKTIPRMALMDYDRYPADIDGEGSGYTQAKARIKAAQSRGMVLVESSPGFNITEPNWQKDPKRPHLAPPTGGILSLYNTGTRCRWYWPCPECDMLDEAAIDRLTWDATLADPEMAARTVKLACRHCGVLIGFDARDDLNAAGIWVPCGCTAELDDAGRAFVVGDPPPSEVASYWLQGTAARFERWSNLIRDMLVDEEEYRKTGDETQLKATINTKHGLPYLPQSAKARSRPELFQARAEPLEEKHVPEGVRFLTTSVDVQKNRFVVQVHGWGPEWECWVVDRYSLRKSRRPDEQGDPLPMAPGSYLDDWIYAGDYLLDRAYPLADQSGREMMSMVTSWDSHGQDGVTEKAYSFWRSLRNRGQENRLMLIRGGRSKVAPLIALTYPDSGRREGASKAEARGEVPVWQLNTQRLKDGANGQLQVEEPGPGFVHFPDWLPDWFYGELTAETYDARKGWENRSGGRNEAWDLFVYGRAACLALKVLAINWEAPPSWAGPWDDNPLVKKIGSAVYATRRRPGRRIRGRPR